MRKWIMFQLCWNVFLWVGTIIGFAIGGETIKIIAVIIGFSSLMLGFTSAMAFAESYSKDWFKTKKELDKKLEEANESWKKAEKLCLIIGRHEAIQLWNKEKDIKPKL